MVKSMIKDNDKETGIKNDKKNDEEEYTKLYRLLTELASKNNTALNTTSNITIESNDICDDNDTDNDSDSNSENEITNKEKAVSTNIETNEIKETKELTDIKKFMYGSNNKYKCDACLKTFSCTMLLDRHYDAFEYCKNWSTLPQEIRNYKNQKPIHYCLSELLEKAITDKNNLECKFCKATFVNKGNLHKHFITSTICNSVAYYELKRIINISI